MKRKTGDRVRSRTVRSTAVFLCLLLLSVLFVTACSGSRKPSVTTAESTNAVESGGESAEFDAVRDIPSKDLNRDFTVLSSFDLGWLEAENSGDKVETAIYRRTMLAEDKYNMSFYISNASGSVYPSLQAATLANDKSFDLVFPHPTDSMVTIMTSGYYANLTDLQNMDLSNPWYNQSQVQNYTTQGNKLYIVTPDISIPNQGFFCLVYNRELYAQFNFADDVTELVNHGEWTAEKFNEILTVTDFELDGDPLGNENYGFLCNAAPSHRWTYAFGESTLVKKADGSFEVGLSTKNMSQIAATYDQLLYTHGDSVQVDFYYNAGIATSRNVSLFKAGHGLFINWDVGSCYSELRGLEFKMGYAPLPKLNDSQKEYRVICASGFYAIPYITTNAEESALIMEFLSGYSYQYLRQAFFEVVIHARMSESQEDYDMLEFLHNSKFFDFGYTLDESEVFVNMLSKAVVDNRNPSSVAVILKGNSNAFHQILEYANNMP